MATRLKRVVVIIAVALNLMALTASAADTLVLIDRSGSMASNFQSGLAKDLATRMLKAAETTGKADLAVFDVEWHVIPGLDSPEFATFGKDTYLDKTLKQFKDKYDRIWLLTDNVQDDPASADRYDMSSFYSTLQAKEIRTIYVFPLRQSPGNAGLMIYAISTGEDTRKLEQQVNTFQRPGQEFKFEKLAMKPLNENVIQVTIIDVEINDAKILHEQKSLRIREGDPLKIETRVRIEPKYPHLYFESSPVTPSRAGTPFKCLVADKPESDINPNQVQTGTSQEYRVTVDFGRVHLKKGPGCIWEAAFGHASESADIETPITVTIPRNNFKLSKTFLADYVASSESEAKVTGKIFGLEKLPGYMAPETTKVPIRIPYRVVVQYPSWPAIVLSIGGVVLLVLVWLVIKLLSGISFAPHFTAETEDRKPLPTLVRDKQVFVSNQLLGSIQSNEFTPAPGVRLDPDLRVADIGDSPLICVLRDGQRIRLRAESGQKPRQKAPTRSTPQKRSAPPTKRTTR